MYTHVQMFLNDVYPHIHIENRSMVDSKCPKLAQNGFLVLGEEVLVNM